MCEILKYTIDVKMCNKVWTVKIFIAKRVKALKIYILKIINQIQNINAAKKVHMQIALGFIIQAAAIGWFLKFSATAF